MNRRDVLKGLVSGAVGGTILNGSVSASENVGGTAKAGVTGITQYDARKFIGSWGNIPDMSFIGAAFWAQRMQDWAIVDGELKCLFRGRNRTVTLLTHQVSSETKDFSATVKFRLLGTIQNNAEKPNYFGFRLAMRGTFEDFRSSIFSGKGISAGVTTDGRLFIGEKVSTEKVDLAVLNGECELSIAISSDKSARLKLIAAEKGISFSSFENDWTGAISLESSFEPDKENSDDNPTVSISELRLEGDGFDFDAKREFGGVYFAQYTVSGKTLKLSAQLAPFDLSGKRASLWLRRGSEWEEMRAVDIHPLARVAAFRINDWDAQSSALYKVTYEMPLKNGEKIEYEYQGTISAEPKSKKRIRALSLSCNWDKGFPDTEVVAGCLKANADMVFFLGDQFYEYNGGFGVVRTPLAKSTLDYLRKWIMFGWSYRDVFRNLPMVAILDDHDVYHGNIWGAGGRATINGNNVVEIQDSGGYRMQAEWVNMAQITQTSHLPDPVDPRPALQDISVYFTAWEYAGISFALVEDRKFKTPPREVYPEIAEVHNGIVHNRSYDVTKYDREKSHLLGEHQMAFLKDWTENPSKTADFRVLLSATALAAAHTSQNPAIKERRENMWIPEKGAYLKDEILTADMDTNGYPQNRRDEVVRLLKNKVSLHLVGDQHLPAVFQYGVDKFEDSTYAFAVPALCNIWVRMWFPPIPDGHKPLPGKRIETGRFHDAFGNKLTMMGVVNPFKQERKPNLLYDCATGYGVVEFDREKNHIVLNCYPRFGDPSKGKETQYDDFPITIPNRA
ncbi:MAG: alkaline phosphatase D family protein [Pyrinomonadaceae bacterium]